jgi:hypothetical protein
MKILLVLLLFLFFNFNDYIKAQHTFEKIILEPEDQIINDVIEDYNGNYIMAGRIKDTESNLYSGYIIKIDSTGNLLQEEIINPNDSISSLFFNINSFDNHFYILGSQMVVYHNTSKLWYLKLTSNLEIEDEKLLCVPDGVWFSYLNSIIDSDTNFVITGYTTRTDSVQGYHNDPAFYKMSLEGDSINSNFLYEPTKMRYAYDLLEDTSNTQYFAFVSRFENTSAGQKLILTKEFDSLSLEPVPLGITDYYSPTYLNDTSIVICGLGTPDQSELYSLNVISVNFENQLIGYNHFEIGENMRDHPAMYNGVTKNENNIYIGGTSNLDYSNPFWSTFDSWFHLVKINPDITPIWEYWYGGDAYYFLYSILATNDGGCIMVGNRFDYETQNQERDIYIIKVDSNGLITWTQEIPINKTVSTVYPNPGSNQLNIKINNKELNFELINLNGQVVIRQIVNNNLNIINTESLKSGIYFYRLIDKKTKAIETGKWIKK